MISAHLCSLHTQACWRERLAIEKEDSFFFLPLSSALPPPGSDGCRPNAAPLAARSGDRFRAGYQVATKTAITAARVTWRAQAPYGPRATRRCEISTTSNCCGCEPGSRRREVEDERLLLAVVSRIGVGLRVSIAGGQPGWGRRHPLERQLLLQLPLERQHPLLNRSRAKRLEPERPELKPSSKVSVKAQVKQKPWVRRRQRSPAMFQVTQKCKARRSSRTHATACHRTLQMGSRRAKDNSKAKALRKGWAGWAWRLG